MAKKTGIGSEYLARSIADKMREANNPSNEVTELLRRIRTLHKKES